MPSHFETSEFAFEWIPASARVPREQQRVMVVLHGRGDRLDSFRSIKDELRIPNFNYLLLNAPRKYDGGYTWYAFPPNQARGIQKSREKLFNLVSELMMEGWASEHIFFYGFSQGCLMSCDFLMNAPFRLGGIVAISGYVYFFSGWQRRLSANSFQIPCLMTHGTKDDALEIEETRAHFKKMKSAGLRVQWQEFEKDHDIDMQEEVPFIREWLLARLPLPKSLPDTQLQY